MLIEGNGYGLDPEVRRCLRNVRDYALRVTEQIEGFRDLLTNILNMNLTLVGVNRNDQIKKVSRLGRPSRSSRRSQRVPTE